MSTKTHQNLNLMLILWSAQIFFIFWGVEYFGKYINPFFLLLSNTLFILIYFKNLQQLKVNFLLNTSEPRKKTILIFFLFLIILTVLKFGISFHHFQNPVKYSDIIPQLDSQYHRFNQNADVYKTMVLPFSKPFPVYMPFHWLPIGITDLFGQDSRWSGVLFLVISLFLYLNCIRFLDCSLKFKVVFISLPFLVIFAFFLKAESEIAISLETIIASYYLILAIGLMKRNLPLIIFGIILCLLSRYTLIFWLPIFLVVFMLNKKYKQLMWTIIFSISALSIFYIFPFIFNNPEIFLTGLKYHNDAAAFEWEHGAWTFENGLYFAPYIDYLIHKDYEFKIFVARILQATMMFTIAITGLIFYSKKREQINRYDFLLGMLYAILISFYLIGPLTYKYYLLTTLLFSTILVIKTADRKPQTECSLFNDAFFRIHF